MRPHVTLTVDLAQLAQDPDHTTGQPEPAPSRHRKARRTLRRPRHGVPPQEGRSRGEHGPVVHVHHIQYWSHGGPTDLQNLVGLCPRCHSLVHQGYVTIDPATHEVHRTLRTRRTSPRHTRAG